MNHLISIIIPVFNAEKYLRQCLDSILAQTYTNYEVVIINDGSTDKSGDIIDDYGKYDDKIHPYHRNNGGVSSARNFGISVASGEYICFIDADDIISNNYLDILYTAIQKGADSSIAGFKHIDVPQDKEIIVVPQKEEIKNLNDSILDFLDFEKPDWQRYLWNRLFKMSVIKKNNIRFREDIYYKEDGVFLVDYLCKSNGLVSYSNQIIYYYRQNQNSALGSLHTKFNKKILTNINAHLLILEQLKKAKLPEATINMSRSHAFMSFAWIKDIMKDNNIHNLYYSFLIEISSFKVLGPKRYFNWKTALLGKFFK